MRPKNASSRETWERIVLAANQVLAEDDGDAIELSLRDVARKAGLSLGTIGYYFASKEELLEACLVHYCEALAEVAKEIGAAVMEAKPETARPIFEQALRRIFRFACAERARLRLRIRNNAARGGLPPLRAVHVRGPYLDTFSTMLAPLVGVSPAQIRMSFQSMTFVVTQYALMSDDEVVQIAGVSGDAGRQRLEDHVVDLGMRALFASR